MASVERLDMTFFLAL